MDGAPVKDEVIPIRLYLKSFNLSPTYRTVQSKFSVRYYLNLVLVDEEERRYFKQQVKPNILPFHFVFEKVLRKSRCGG